jgi:serine/threonine kinase 38
MSNAGGLFTGLQRPFSARRKKTEDMGKVDAGGNGLGEQAVSEATRLKVETAKQYIENMYKVQHQNIAERYARYVRLPVPGFGDS